MSTLGVQIEASSEKSAFELTDANTKWNIGGNLQLRNGRDLNVGDTKISLHKGNLQHEGRNIVLLKIHIERSASPPLHVKCFGKGRITAVPIGAAQGAAQDFDSTASNEPELLALNV